MKIFETNFKLKDHLNIHSAIIFIITLALVAGPLVAEIALFFGIIFIFFNTSKITSYINFYKKSVFVFFLFYLLIIFSSFYSIDATTSLIRSIFYIRFFFLILIFSLFFEKEKNINIFAIFFIIIFSIFLIDSLIQFSFGNNILGYPYTLGRVTSFFNDEHILGSYISRFYPFILSLIFFSKLNKKNYYIYFITISSLVMVYLSSERTAFGLLIIVLFFLTFLKQFRIFFLFFLIFLIFMILNKSANLERLIDHTINQIYNKKENKIYLFSERHQNHYKTSWEIFLDNKNFGTGIKTFRIVCKQDKYSNDIIKNFLNTGEKYVSPVDGQAITIEVDKDLPQASRNFDIIILNGSDPKDLDSIADGYIKNKKLDLNLQDYKNYVIHYKIPGWLPDIDKRFSSIEIFNLNRFYVQKNQILFIKPPDQFVDGCNTHPHNTYLQLLSETGLYSFLIILFIFLIVTFNVVYFFYKSLKLNDDFSKGLLMINLCFFINLFPLVPTGSFFNNFLSFVYLIPVGLYFGINKRKIT